MALSERENFLRNARFQRPQYMPCLVVISLASWDQWRHEMEDVVLRHPLLFPSHRKGDFDFDNLPFAAANRKDEDFRDAWGCLWRSAMNGIEGVVVEHPLKDWSALENWRPPDPLTTGDRGPVNWAAVRSEIAATRKNGHTAKGWLPHGFFLMRLAYLRGFENLMVDLLTEPLELCTLVDRVTAHNLTIIDQFLSIGIDCFHFQEDLGTQSASIVSPALFRKWCVPEYRKLMRPCRRAGALVYLHSDGHILELLDALAECGVDIINPQDLVNGIDDLQRACKDRFCISLDIDRQKIVPFGTRAEIRRHIEEAVRKLGSPRGGLELVCGIYPPTPPDNVDAVCSAMEEFRTWWFDGRATGA